MQEINDNEICEAMVTDPLYKRNGFAWWLSEGKVLSAKEIAWRGAIHDVCSAIYMSARGASNFEIEQHIGYSVDPRANWKIVLNTRLNAFNALGRAFGWIAFAIQCKLLYVSDEDRDRTVESLTQCDCSEY